jgi:hypothetical protein
MGLAMLTAADGLQPHRIRGTNGLRSRDRAVA